MADDNKSYKLNLDKAKGQQVELLDQTENATYNSNKSGKSGGTRQTLKIKNKKLDEIKSNAKPKNVIERPANWDDDINNTAVLQDLDLVCNEEAKHQVAQLMDKGASKSSREIFTRQGETNKKILQQQSHLQQDEPSMIDLPAVSAEIYKVPVVKVSEKGLGSVSKAINDINRRLEFIPENHDPEVRSTNSSKVMQFTPSFPKKDPIDSYSRVEFGNSPVGSHDFGTPKGESNRRQMSSRELHLELTKELLKIERLKRRGYQPSRNFTILDKYDEIKSERVRLEEISSLDSSIQFQKNGLLFVSSFIEMANSQYNNVFDLSLNGWSDSINDNIDTFEPIFEKLHDKYKDSVQLAPELQLIVAFVGSAVSYHFSQQLLKKAESSIPGFGAVMGNNPALKKMYTDTAANMFAQNMIGKDGGKGNQPKGGGGGGDLLAGLLGGGGGGGGMLSGLFGGSAPAPVVSATKANGVQLQEPKGLDELLGDINLSRLSEASLRVDDDLTSHITGPGPRNVQTGSSKRTVKRR